MKKADLKQGVFTQNDIMRTLIVKILRYIPEQE